MKRRDIMIDVETLGTEKDSTVIQIGAVVFELYTGKILDELNLFIDITSNDYPNFRVDPSTLKWWLKTDSNLFNNIINNDKAVSYTEAIKKLCDFLKPNDKTKPYLWGNGSSFDNVIVKQFVSYSEFRYPIRYSDDRDFRTLVSLAAMKKGMTSWEYREAFKRESVFHDALEDAKHQVKVLVTAYREIMGDLEPCVD